ncbi:MAG TPA: helix-turn-helix domain-containing protein, partial [Rhizomicrobium sp.]|nr:helix-turn-helix domain-containing protein [Rhizomicrobium sp.]
GTSSSSIISVTASIAPSQANQPAERITTSASTQNHAVRPVNLTSEPCKAAALVGSALDHLLQGERIAVLAEDQELSPTDAAKVLGISRPLVVHRMNIGDLPFRYVGAHRRAKLKDILALQTQIDSQRKAMEALAESTEELIRDHGL